MSGTRTPTLVVGIDGSDRSTEALDWASDYARSIGAMVKVVTAWRFPEVLGHRPARAESDLSAAMEERVRELVEESCSGVPHQTVIQEDAAADLLVREAKDADLLVLGGPAPGTQDHPGPVTIAVLKQSRCPVVVVPAAGPPSEDFRLY